MIESTDLTESDIKRYQLLKSKILNTFLGDDVFKALGLALLNFDIEFTTKMPFGSKVPACVVYNTNTIYINPNSYLFDSFPVTDSFRINKVLSIVLLHEVLHPLMMHNRRRGGRDGYLWALATDFEINLFIRNLEIESALRYSSQSLPPVVKLEIRGIPSGNILLDYNFNNMTAEQIYDYLKQNCEADFKSSSMSMNDFRNYLGIPKVVGDDEDVEVIDVTVRIPSGVDGGVKEYNHRTVQLPDFSPENENDETKKSQLDQRILSCRRELTNELMRGNISEQFKKFLGSIFSVKIDWKRITKDSILSILIPSSYSDWGEPTDEFLANALDIPYMPCETKEEKYGIACLTIDESASMSDHDVLSGISIAWEARRYYKGLLIAKHDYDSVTIDYFQSSDDISDSQFNNLAHRKHCGGTSHKWVFEAISKFIKTNTSDKISIIIGITDLFSDLATTQYILPMIIPRVWIVNSKHNVHGLVGRIIRI